jgi:thioredoxin
MKLKTFLYPLFTLIFAACSGQTSKNSTKIEAKAFSEKLAATPNAQLIDVRTPSEFATDHLDNAKNINWMGTDFTSKVATLDKSKPVFVYCKSGGRSESAAEKLEQLGFTTIYELQGGILKWDAAGLSKPSGKIMGMTQDQYKQLLQSNQKVLINFYAEWCAPCKKMAPYVTAMQKEKGATTIIRLDADANKTLMTELKISELPTLLLYDNQALVWRQSGFVSEEDLRKQIQ